MSLRWIYENLEPPNCEEECSDIDDSCSSDGSYDSDLVLIGPEDNANNNIGNGEKRRRRVNHDKKNSGGRTEKRVRILAPCVEPSQPETDNPTHQSLKLKLFCRSGYYIGITSTGRARGYTAANANDVHVRLNVCPVTCGVIRLQSEETGHFLAFNSTGHLYGEKKMSKDNTEWEQRTIGDYDAFRSRKYAEQNWWLAIKRNGRLKPGPRTAWGQKSIQFLPIRLA